MTHFLHFRDPLAAQTIESGGKGANLAKLTQAGFLVPRGFVLRAQAFREFISAAPDLFSTLARFPLNDPAALAAEAASLRINLAQIPLPAVLASELREALADFPPDQSFSVRSSSTLEDLALAAFAGQHETFLNCIGEARILDAIKSCYLSLFADRAIAYRAQLHFPHEQAAMAVVVQQMIPCEVAGVAFTINPITGGLSELLINSNFGLGESVVSGEFQIDQFALDKSTLSLRSQLIGHKSHKVVPASSTYSGGFTRPSSLPCRDRSSDRPSESASASPSGVTQVPLTLEESSASSLSPDQLNQIASLALRVENHFHFPQDIEWGIASDQLFLLQSRPITTIPPRWTRDESAERFPTAITPLTWEFIEDGFHRSLTYSLRLMGFPPFQGKWFAMFDHYIYGNQNAVDLYLKRVPLTFNTLPELEAALPLLRQNYRWVQELPLLWSRDLDQYLIRIGEFLARPIESEPIPILWNYVKEVRELGARYFQPNIAISITQALLHRLLYYLLSLTVGPNDANRLHDALLAFCETKTGMINAELYTLAEEVRSTPALLQLFREHSSPFIIEQKLLPPFRDFSNHFETFLRLHGHREVEFDAYHPTWQEIPWVVLDHIRLLLGAQDLSMGDLAPPSISRPADGPNESTTSPVPVAAPAIPPFIEDEYARVVEPLSHPKINVSPASLDDANTRSPSPGKSPRPTSPSGHSGGTPVVPAAIEGEYARIVEAPPRRNGESANEVGVPAQTKSATEQSRGAAPASSRPLVPSPAQREHELRLRMHKAELELFARLSPGLHFFFHEFIRLTRAYTSLDDLEHYQTTRLTLPLRKGLRELGRRLYIRGVIADPMDIFFAHVADLEKAVQANDDKVWRTLGESIRAEKDSYLRDRLRTPAWSLEPACSDGFTQPSSPVAPSCSTDQESQVASHVLSGLPGSPGQATGSAYLVRSMDDFAACPKGAVLVARTTNPTWTPLFYNAVAVVTESGGPLSHGAVTAREMQIPAVMSVRDCMSALKNGDTVQVDGSRGQVTLLQSAPQPKPAP